MRPQQQNRRMRGRNNNNNNQNNNSNRRGPNPLTRSYESNGPDVKIRGSAQQIAEKYTTLARDATSAGDRVMAENYLQHAEHYNRIIAAAQAQMPIQHQQNVRDPDDDEMDDERDEFDPPMAPQNYGQNRQRNENFGNNGGQNAYQNPAPAVNHAEAPQPVIEGMPAEVAFNAEVGGDGNRPERGEGRESRQNRFRDRRRDRRFDNLSGVLTGGGNNRPNESEPAQAAATPRVEAAAEATQVEQGAIEQPAPRQAPAEPRVVPVPSESVAPSLEAAPAVSETTQPAAEGEQPNLFAAPAAEGDGAARRGRRPRRSRKTEGEDGQSPAGEASGSDFDPNQASVAE